MREKLIELIGTTEYGNGSLIGKNFQKGFIEKIADHLIANGVTVQRWIPVTERLPTEEEADDDGFVFAYTIANKKIIARWTDVCRFSVLVTHWMPLPEPPKGE